MTLGSLFDGSGGFPLAGVLAGIMPVWASEVEPYPIAVTRSRFPNMQHLGDVTRIDGAKITPVDIVTFGSPCQDLSVAGKRAGIQHIEHGAQETTRSGLFYEAVRIITQMRSATDGRFPRFAVWENVPGAFSSNGGEDFRCVLEELSKIADEEVSIPRPSSGRWSAAGEIVADGYSIAWRTLNAQYWGVPQRRRRIYLVADFGGQRAGKILFERPDLRGHPETGRETRRTTVAADAGGSAAGDNPDGSGFARVVPEVFHTLTAANCRNVESAQRADCVCYALDCRNITANVEVSATIQAHNGGGYNPAYINPVAYNARGNGGKAVSETVTGDNDRRITDYTNILCMATAQANAEIESDLSPKILHGHTQPFSYIVRRLTPLECCRLQGFPDGWGEIGRKDGFSDGEEAFWERIREDHAHVCGKAYSPMSTRAALVQWYNRLHTDSAEYRMWGNGIALPCARYVMDGIASMI